MKKFFLFKSFLTLGLALLSYEASAQLTCATFTATGPSSSGYNMTQDPSCSVCGGPGTTPWTGVSCAGTITVTATPATTSLSMGFTSVNTDDYATISVDGGGTMSLSVTNCGLSGNVIGPYQCGGLYGDIFVTVNSTLPFTTVTIVNTGCSSGWVIACPGTTPNAGADDLINPICTGTLNLNTLVTGDPGGVWDETTTSGQFNAGTGVFTVGGLAPGNYTFTYTVTSCGATDVANFEVQVGGGGNAGADNSTTLCGSASPSLNLNTLLVGADPGGTWAETTSSGQFNAGTGVLTTTGLAGGTYTFTYTLTGVGACPSDVATITVNIDPGPQADFDYIVNGQSSADGAPITACITNPITFDNNSSIPPPGSIVTTTWDFGNGDGSSSANPPPYNYSSTGIYFIELTVESDLGCTDVISIPIEITNGPTLTITSNEPTCYGFSDGSVTINTSGAGTYVFEISDSVGAILNIANSNTANQLESGWYYLFVDDGLGCAGVDSIFLDEPGEMSADLIINQPLCYGNPTGLVIADTVYNYTGSYNNVSYFWNPNPSGQNGIGKDSCAQLGPGTYSLTLNDQNGCSNTQDFTIVYPDSLYFIELGSEPAYCRLFSYQSGNGVVYAAASGGTPDYGYAWTNVATGAATANTTWGGLNPGTYQVSVTDDNGCTLSAFVVLDSLNPIADFEMTTTSPPSDCFGTTPVPIHFVNQSLYFSNPNDPNSDTTFFWNFNSPTGPWIISHDVNETYDSIYYEGGTYTICLVAINKNGCSDTLCTPIELCDPLIFEPVNIFTPDGDGVNDEFTFDFRSQAVTEFQCTIVDRWGVVMFEMTSVSDKWDGKTKGGKKCADGVYFYTYSGTSENGTFFEGQGSLQLINSQK